MGQFAALPDGTKRAHSTTPEAVIGLLAGMAAWEVMGAWLAEAITGAVAFSAALAPVSLLMIRATLLVGLAWLVYTLFG